MVKKTPFTLLYSISTFIFDAVLPPRPTQALTRELEYESLTALANRDGTLPYHDARVRALVWEIKYRGNAHAAALAGSYLSELLLAEASEELGVPLLIPMPMHQARRKERGFNQTELLCEAVLKALGKSSRKNNAPGKNRIKKVLGSSLFGDIHQTIFAAIFSYAPNALEKIVHTAPQQGLPQHERLKNVKGSMRANPQLVKGRVCIVVDDVKTTGASFKEAERALRSSGARAVVCIALAQS